MSSMDAVQRKHGVMSPSCLAGFTSGPIGPSDCNGSTEQCSACTSLTFARLRREERTLDAILKPRIQVVRQFNRLQPQWVTPSSGAILTTHEGETHTRDARQRFGASHDCVSLPHSYSGRRFNPRQLPRTLLAQSHTFPGRVALAARRVLANSTLIGMVVSVTQETSASALRIASVCGGV
jgi:hypothetical protein